MKNIIIPKEISSKDVMKFLRDNLTRNREDKNNAEFDQHVFCCNDSSLGQHNSEQLKFYKSKV